MNSPPSSIVTNLNRQHSLCNHRPEQLSPIIDILYCTMNKIILVALISVITLASFAVLSEGSEAE